MVRFKRMWVKALFKSDPKINPNFALDIPTYTKTCLHAPTHLSVPTTPTASTSEQPK